MNGARGKWKGWQDKRDKCGVSRALGTTASSSPFSSLPGRGCCGEGGGAREEWKTL